MPKTTTPATLILGEDSIAFIGHFRAALGGMPATTFYRHIRSGIIPPPDTRIGRRPAWRISTIRATLDKLIAAGDQGNYTLPTKPRRGGGE